MIIFGIWNSFILKTVSLLLYDIFHKRENQLQNNFTSKYPSEKKYYYCILKTATTSIFVGNKSFNFHRLTNSK